MDLGLFRAICEATCTSRLPSSYVALAWRSISVNSGDSEIGKTELARNSVFHVLMAKLMGIESKGYICVFKRMKIKGLFSNMVPRRGLYTI